jgi:uncharacterized protein (TIGR02118 family)
MPIKIVFCLRRKEGISREEFQRYWLEEHAPRVKRHAAAIGMRRYCQSHTLETPLNAAVAGARGAPDPYDGVMEGWWDSEEALLGTLASPEAQAAGRDLLEDEARFIDLANSPIFFTREDVIFE